MAGWVGWARVITVDNGGTQAEWLTHSDGVGTMVVGIAKIFQKKYFLVGIAFNEHGGKTGRAMIKYPLYKKNAQRKNTLVYPGLTTASFDRIINLCLTTMF